MKHASEAEGPEAGEPGDRGWFQPISRSAAADVTGPAAGDVGTPADDPAETGAPQSDTEASRAGLTRPRTTFDTSAQTTFDAFRAAVRPAPDPGLGPAWPGSSGADTRGPEAAPDAGADREEPAGAAAERPTAPRESPTAPQEPPHGIVPPGGTVRPGLEAAEPRADVSETRTDILPVSAVPETRPQPTLGKAAGPRAKAPEADEPEAEGARAEPPSPRTETIAPQAGDSETRVDLPAFSAFWPAIRPPVPDAGPQQAASPHPDTDPAGLIPETSPPATESGRRPADAGRQETPGRPAQPSAAQAGPPGVQPGTAAGAAKSDPGRFRAEAASKILRAFGNAAPAGAGGAASGSAAEASPPPASPAPPAGKAASKKASRSVFGMEPAARPDILTDAETVIMPSLEGSKAKTPGPSALSGKKTAASGQAAAAAKQQPITTMTPVGTSAAFAEETTQVLPALEPAKSLAGASSSRSRRKTGREAFQPPQRYTPGRRTTTISRLVLLAVLCLQAVLSLRLRNTAFEDEALYLYSGHMELEHLLHGSALYGGFSSYFSGAPVLYPLLAAAVDQLGGLAMVRALSLVEMLATTALLYSLTRRLFNERVGLCAAALFSVTEATIFLGNFATYDATCLSLLAFAAWIAVRTAGFRWPAFLLAAPVAALAVGVKYAGLLFVPTIAVLPALAGWPERGGRRVLWYPFGFVLVVAGLLSGALRLGGHAYLSAMQSTTTNRAQGTVPYGTIMREAAEWGGVLFAVAVIGAIAYVWRVRTEPDEKIAPAGGRLRRAALGAVLTGTALLAPAYQAYLHTDVSFLKHIGFGLFFAAPMAGFGLARIMGDYFRRPHFGIGIWSLALVLGMVQSSYLYHVWPSSGPFISAFSKYLKPNASYLVEVPEVPMYYLQGRSDAQPKQFTSTYPIAPLTTDADFAKVVKTGEFQVIAYTGVVTPGPDQALARALAASHSYYLAAKISAGDSSGPVDYYIWVKGHSSSSGSTAKKAAGAA